MASWTEEELPPSIPLAEEESGGGDAIRPAATSVDDEAWPLMELRFPPRVGPSPVLPGCDDAAAACCRFFVVIDSPLASGGRRQPRSICSGPPGASPDCCRASDKDRRLSTSEIDGAVPRPPPPPPPPLGGLPMSMDMWLGGMVVGLITPEAGLIRPEGLIGSRRGLRKGTACRDREGGLQ